MNYKQHNYLNYIIKILEVFTFTFLLFKPLTKIVTLTIEPFGVNTFLFGEIKMNIENINLHKHPGLFSSIII